MTAPVFGKQPTVVVIEVQGGCVTQVTSTDPELAYRIVDYDDLKESEDVCCPACGSNDFHPDYSTAEDYFICDACNHCWQLED